MTNLSFDGQIDEYMVYCHSRQLSQKTMVSYEQSLRLFRRWCSDELKTSTVGQVTESSIRHYIVRLILAVVSVVCPVFAGVLLLLTGKWIVFSE